MASCLSQAALVLAGTACAGVAIAVFVVVLAVEAVEGVCENVMPVKNASKIKVIKILDAVFIICLFL